MATTLFLAFDMSGGGAANLTLKGQTFANLYLGEKFHFVEADVLATVKEVWRPFPARDPKALRYSERRSRTAFLFADEPITDEQYQKLLEIGFVREED